MADSEIQDVGIYNASAPPLDPMGYSTLGALVDVTSGLVVTGGGNDAASLSSNTTAEAWYRLETQMNSATKKLGEVNDAVAREIKSLNDNLKGVAGDEFNKVATDLLKKSQDLYNTLDTKEYGLMVGNIGHCIQWFANRWWEIVDANDKKKTDAQLKLRTLAAAQAEVATTTSDLQSVLDQLQTAFKNLDDDAEKALIKDLQDLLGEMGRQYNARGQDLAPIYIAGGHETTNNGNGNNQGYQQGQRMQALKGRTLAPLEQQGQYAPGEETEGGATGPGNSQLDAAKKAAEDAIDGVKAKTTDPEAQKALDDAKKAVGDAIAGLGGGAGGGESAGGAPGTGSGGGSPGSGALDAAKKAAGDAIDGLKGGTTDPAAQKALDDAQKAASDAIDGLTGGSGGGEGSGAGGGGMPGMGTPGGGSGGGRSTALDDAKKAAQDAIDGLKGGTAAPEADKALEDAKKAVGDAIDGLDGSGDDDAKDEAKPASDKAVDDAIGKTDDPEAKQALEDAKKAAGDAIDKIAADRHADALKQG